MGGKFTIFVLYSRANSKYKLPGGGGAYFRRADLTQGFLRYNFGGLLFGGAYTWSGLLSEFYGLISLNYENINKISIMYKIKHLLKKVSKILIDI